MARAWASTCLDAEIAKTLVADLELRLGVKSPTAGDVKESLAAGGALSIAPEAAQSSSLAAPAAPRSPEKAEKTAGGWPAQKLLFPKTKPSDEEKGPA